MKQIIAMHGWSGDSNGWNRWSHHFRKKGWYWQSGERGYGSLPAIQPNWEKDSETSNKQIRIIICHSLGAHLLKEEVFQHANKVVFLCSFSKFIPTGSEGRAIRTALTGMKNCLGTKNEEAMLSTFLQKACSPAPTNSLPSGPIDQGISHVGRQNLQADLDLLMQTSGIPSGLSPLAKVLVVEGAQDLIVTPSSRKTLLEDLEKHLKEKPTFWSMPEMGHALLDPNLIKRVQSWLA